MNQDTDGMPGGWPVDMDDVDIAQTHDHQTDEHPTNLETSTLRDHTIHVRASVHHKNGDLGLSPHSRNDHVHYPGVKDSQLESKPDVPGHDEYIQRKQPENGRLLHDHHYQDDPPAQPHRPHQQAEPYDDHLAWSSSSGGPQVWDIPSSSNQEADQNRYWTKIDEIQHSPPQIAEIWPNNHVQPDHRHTHAYGHALEDREYSDLAHRQHRSRLKRRARRVANSQDVQIVVPEDRNKGLKGISESMQMMMINQMMNQQMAQQQMQMLQMNHMLGASGNGNKGTGNQRPKRPSVNIKTRQKPKKKAPIPIVVAPAVPQPPVLNTIESAAMENWQEATIILCIAIVGVIYLVVSRSTKEEKDPDAVAKHLVPRDK